MTNRFLISVAAAALIAGTGLANAQGAGGMKSEGGAGAAQQTAPSGAGGAATQRDGMTSGQSDKALGAGKEAQDLKGSKAQQNTASDADRKGGKDMKAEGRDGREKSGTVGQAPDKSGTTTQGREDKGGAAMGREDRMKEPGQKGAQQKEGTSTTDGNRAQGAQTGSQTTTGMAPAAPPPEKRAEINTAIKSSNIQEVNTNINVSISVGARLPATIRYYPLPPRIVEIYPEWRGYQVVLIKGRYVIVRPQTHEIVYIIEG